MNIADLIEGGKLLLALGLEVYKAIKAGQTSKTVGEIYEGVRRDHEILAEIEADAEARIRARSE